jgi:hypothetical protein
MRSTFLTALGGGIGAVAAVSLATAAVSKVALSAMAVATKKRRVMFDALDAALLK